ncbi:MAG: hypothetical protein IJY73_02820 [Oscillospiraceae bacterium]|nr:hypothetical protein [Oscillospiraceae bacterium]
MKNIILAGFDGRDNPARTVTEKAELDCTKLILPNDKEKSAELLLETIHRVNAVCVIILGQKPCIKDKIAVEPTSEGCGNTLHTSLDVTVTAEKLKANGYNAYISKGCGNSYCNHIYYECLQSGTNCIFLHIPQMKNISDINTLTKAVEGYIRELGSVPSML